ncbi:aminopeptidase N [Salinimicrobium catena]|uniref:Aminopeptidase N n=1 Tax=Salinimicrobium catena TaxID=390640 RepID=A0A1H5L4I8_9FLAO|nr:M1 family metallopeptidase [Salinimicrobium catena]SDL05583.1 aminopeptidase N [Salinimicrobium catena]SEE71913.1 aminopeptidase N [Salinimicrobium catena]
MKKLFLNHFLLFFAGFAFAQEKPVTDFKHLQAEISIMPVKGEVSGDLTYTFDVLQPTDSVFVDAQKMEFQKVLLNGKEVPFKNDGKRLWITRQMERSEDNVLEITYSANPTQSMYFIENKPEGEEQEYQVWTQGQGKYTSNWLPSFDDVNEKVEFDLSFIYKKGKTLTANGVLQSSEAVNDSLTRWHFDMEQPMSSYLLAVAAGNYEVEERESDSGVPLKLFYPEGEEQYVEPTYRHTEMMMDFFEKEIGVKYPWQNYKQIPVQDFLYSGMENTGTTIFSDLFLVDSIGFHDRNYVMVNAHELAHQWFGDMVTAVSGEHHWLQEGFATYYALLAEREIFGEDYYYWKLFQSAEELKQMSDSGKGEALLNPKAGSLTFYQKGAWALHILKELVGREAFDAGVKNYLEKHAYQNVTTQDFLAEVEQASGMDLGNFRKNWLEQSAFQGSEALESLKRSEFIRNYLEIAALKQLPLESKKELLEKALDFPVNDYIGQEVVHQLALEEISEVLDLYKKSFATNNLYVRQAIALSLNEIPQELKSSYESLLTDDSYLTREAALFNLWMNFPEDRAVYLSKMQGQEGFSDKNLRTLWLALSIATPDFHTSQKEEYLKELRSYTAPYYRFQLRKNAFGYLFQLNAFSSENIRDLMEASGHHAYRFRDFAKNLLQQVYQTSDLLPEDRTLLEKELGINAEVEN